MKHFLWILILCVGCKSRTSKISLPLEGSEPSASQEITGFALTDEGEYKKEISNYRVTLSSQGTGGSWSNLGMLLLGYSCSRKLSLVFTEETTTESNGVRTIATKSDFDYSFFSSLNQISTNVSINSLNKNPKIYVKERLWCDRNRKHGIYDHIWLEWESVQDGKSIFSDTQAEKTTYFKPEEKNISFVMIFSSLRSIMIGFLTSYRFTLTTKFLGRPKFFDYSNCKPDSKTKPFYFHITQGFGTGEKGVNPYTLGLLVDGLAIPSTPEVNSIENTGAIKSVSGYYGLAIKYCPLIDKPYMDIRAYAKASNWYSSDELYLSRFKSLRLVRGENVQMSFDHKKFVGGVETSTLNISVYNQDITLKPGESLSSQVSSKAEAALRRQSYIKDDMIYNITALEHEFATCASYPRGEDLASYVSASFQGSDFEKLISREEILRGLEAGKAKGLGLTSLGSVIAAHPITFGLLATSVVVAGVSVGLTQLAKQKQSGQQAVVDKFSTYGAYMPCVSFEATKAHFEETVRLLQDELRNGLN